MQVGGLPQMRANGRDGEREKYSFRHVLTSLRGVTYLALCVRCSRFPVPHSSLYPLPGKTEITRRPAYLHFFFLCVSYPTIRDLPVYTVRNSELIFIFYL